MSSPPRKSSQRPSQSLISSSLFHSAEDVSIAIKVPRLIADPDLDDDSYRSAKELVESGALGDVHAVETNCLDQQDPTGFFVTFSAQSGGIFVDMGVHDVCRPRLLNFEHCSQ
jgi:hypothetical protein